MVDEFIPYGRQSLDEDDIGAVVDVLRSDFLTTGPKVEEFERAVSAYVGTRYAVSSSRGTSALHGACFAAGISQGDEVITSPMTFAASANCVLYQGGRPVFSDIDPETYLLDLADVREKMTDKTRAIIPVDYTGQPCDMDEIMSLAREHNLVVIEDAAHSIGATYKGRKVGTLADMTMFSFHPVKHITTGEGGMIVTDSRKYYDRLRQFRTHGITRDDDKLQENHGSWYYEMQFLGYNYRMTDIQAALGVSQLKKLDGFIERRREIVRKYNEAFQGVDELILPNAQENRESSWHIYVVQLREDMVTISRREFFEKLRAENIGVNVHYIPVHLLPYYKGLGYRRGDYPQAEELYENIVTLPLYPGMSDEDVRIVIESVKRVLVEVCR